MRQLENSLGFQSDFGLLSDDKALRYTSKAAALLGTWRTVVLDYTELKNALYMSYGIAMPCFVPLGAW
jgi:hypothetical protein